jgi:hypothetical protein
LGGSCIASTNNVISFVDEPDLVDCNVVDGLSDRCADGSWFSLDCYGDVTLCWGWLSAIALEGEITGLRIDNVCVCTVDSIELVARTIARLDMKSEENTSSQRHKGV